MIYAGQSLLYANNQKNRDDALALTDAIYYQGCQVYLTFMNKKTCFAYKSIGYLINAYKGYILRYLRLHQPSL